MIQHNGVQSGMTRHDDDYEVITGKKCRVVLDTLVLIHSFIHSFIHFNSGSKAHKTTDKSSDIKAYTNIKAQKGRQRIHRENCTEEC